MNGPRYPGPSNGHGPRGPQGGPRGPQSGPRGPQGGPRQQGPPPPRQQNRSGPLN